LLVCTAPQTPARKNEEKTETAAGIVPSIRPAFCCLLLGARHWKRAGVVVERGIIATLIAGFSGLPAPVPRQMMCGPAFKSHEFLSFHQQLAFSGKTQLSVQQATPSPHHSR